MDKPLLNPKVQFQLYLVGWVHVDSMHQGAALVRAADEDEAQQMAIGAVQEDLEYDLDEEVMITQVLPVEFPKDIGCLAVLEYDEDPWTETEIPEADYSFEDAPAEETR